MAKDKTPATPAVRVLRHHQAAFTPRAYAYQDKGGTEVAARELGVDEHRVIKTLVMEDAAGNPLVVLMHGDCQVSTKALARELGVRQVTPCDPAVVARLTGYQVGGVSPFGTKHPMPVYIQRTILDLATIHINGGRRGFLVEMTPAELIRVLKPTPVEVRQ